MLINPVFSNVANNFSGLVLSNLSVTVVVPTPVPFLITPKFVVDPVDTNSFLNSESK